MVSSPCLSLRHGSRLKRRKTGSSRLRTSGPRCGGNSAKHSTLNGSAIALPPDPELRADLCAPTWKLTARGILLESKDGSSGFGNLRQRLGRSPGKGDAVVMAWSEGNAAAVSRHNNRKWEQYRDRRQAWIV